MYDEDKVEQACRKMKCRFEWETDVEIEITLPKGKTYPDGRRYKLFCIEDGADEIIDYIERAIS